MSRVRTEAACLAAALAELDAREAFRRQREASAEAYLRHLHAVKAAQPPERSTLCP